MTPPPSPHLGVEVEEEEEEMLHVGVVQSADR
jgi:hypothetical protein